MPASVLRFAPSPNGFLHLGHAYSALMNERVAARLGGTLLLRLEDIDPVRCRPGYADAVIGDLGWLGIPWSGPVWRQSGRLSAYAAALARLEAEDLLYPCFCTRGQIAAAVAGRAGWPRDPDGAPLYPGTCRSLHRGQRRARLAAGDTHALRLDMTAACARRPSHLHWVEYREGREPDRQSAEPARWGDAVLARKDVRTSYHLAVVVDDAAQGVTDVVRGRDLFCATSLHRLLQDLLGLPAPNYHHHRLLVDADGSKFAKRKGSRALRDLRRAGTTATAVIAQLGFGEIAAGRTMASP